MSHIKFFVLLAACCLSAACTQDRLTPPEDAGMRSSAAKGDLRLELQLGDNPDTKTAVDGTTGVMTWTTGDRVAVEVIPGMEASPDGYYVGAVTVSGSSAYVDVPLEDGQARAGYAVYPANSHVGRDVNTSGYLWIKYPDSYDLTGMTAAQRDVYSPVPMVARNSDTDHLTFYQTGGLLRLTASRVPAGATGLRIVFTGVEVTGTYQVVNGGTSAATLIRINQQPHGSTVTFTFAASPLTAETDITVNLPLPQGDYSACTGFVLTTIDDSGDMVTEVNENPVAAWATTPVARTFGYKMTVDCNP